MEVARRACTADSGDRPELRSSGRIIDFVCPELWSSGRIIDFVLETGDTNASASWSSSFNVAAMAALPP